MCGVEKITVPERKGLSQAEWGGGELSVPLFSTESFSSISANKAAMTEEIIAVIKLP